MSKETFDVRGKNKNGTKIVDFCPEREMCVANTFQHRGIYKYTWSSLSDNLKWRNMNDLILVKEDILRDVYRVEILKGISDQMVVL